VIVQNLWNDAEELKEAARAARAGKHDPARVDISDGYEVRRWCQRLLCTESTLRQVVAVVGEDPAKVQAAVERRR
jgi:hypothetical protein